MLSSSPAVNNSRMQFTYFMRILVWLTSFGIVLAVYGGDAYVGAVLLVFAIGLFAAGIVPGVINDLIRYVFMAPFVLGAFIPLQRAFMALIRFRWVDLGLMLLLAALYGVAVLMLANMPTRMRRPFMPFLPETFFPAEEVAAWKHGPKSTPVKSARGKAPDQPKQRGGLFNRGGGDKKPTRSTASSTARPSKSEGRKGLFNRGGDANKKSAQPRSASGSAQKKPAGRGGLFNRGGGGDNRSSGKAAASSPAQPKKQSTGGGLFNRGGKKQQQKPASAASASSNKSEPKKKSGGGLFGRNKGPAEPGRDAGTVTPPSPPGTSAGGTARYGSSSASGSTGATSGSPYKYGRSSSSYGGSGTSSGMPVGAFFEDDDDDFDDDIYGGSTASTYGGGGASNPVGAFFEDDDEDDNLFSGSSANPFGNFNFAYDDDDDSFMDDDDTYN